MLKAVDAGLASVCKRKGKPVNQQEMLRAANETLCFFHWATTASLRIKSLAKFSYVSLELVSGVIWRQWRLSCGSLSPGTHISYPALQQLGAGNILHSMARFRRGRVSQSIEIHTLSCLLFLVFCPSPEQNLLKWTSWDSRMAKRCETFCCFFVVVLNMCKTCTDPLFYWY